MIISEDPFQYMDTVPTLALTLIQTQTWTRYMHMHNFNGQLTKYESAESVRKKIQGFCSLSDGAIFKF
jgi:hypothetical protein